jgi:hypothetical protein
MYLHHFGKLDPDPDPAYHFDGDPDPTFQCHAGPQHCILDSHSHIHADPDPVYHFYGDPDPTFQCHADPCGSRSGFATLLFLQSFEMKKKVTVLDN